MDRRERVLIVTGRLAEAVVRQTAAQVQARAHVDFEIHVLPITVAALMHTTWVERKLEWSPGWQFDRVLLPGYCQGETTALSRLYGIPFQRGPKDILDLPEFFGLGKRKLADLSRYDIEILAEINHAPRMSLDQILQQAEHYRTSGADLIDLGCIPGECWSRVRSAVTALRQNGFRVSIDSFDQQEVTEAVEAGAELVLSANLTNIDWAIGLPVEWVLIPDETRSLDSLQPTIDAMRSGGRKFRIDPILDPVGVGFAAAVERYAEARRRWPDVPVMMGIGNVTELTDADSAGLNVMLVGICAELGIRSVLTTEVIRWARTSVREIDLARRLMHYAVTHDQVPKYLEPRLIVLRDAKTHEFGIDALREMQATIKDPNWRLFAEDGQFFALNAENFLAGSDPFELFAKMDVGDASHAFYLGYELAKAQTALTLGKWYRQDQALDWGYLTVEERTHWSGQGKADSGRNGGEDRTS